MFRDWSTLKKLIWLRRFNGGSGPVYKTASGAIVHITDALAAPLKKLVAQIEPIQDLHGYDSPWPPGGGKNLIDNSTSAWENGGINSSGNNATASEQKRTIGKFTVQGGRDIKISGITEPTTSSLVRIFFYASDDSFIEYKNYSSNYWPVPDNATSFRLRAPIDYDLSTLQIEYGTVVTTYSPYSNECPITGRTGMSVYADGKNLLGLSADDIVSTQRATNTFSNGSITVNATGTYARTQFHKKVISGQQYTISLKGLSTGDYNRFYIKPIDDWNTAGTLAFFTLTGTETAYTKTFTATSDDLYIYLYVTTSATTGTMTISDIQLELGSTVTAYEPYTGRTIPVSWQTEAGTVYGCTVDVVTGDLIADRAIYDLGDVSWTHYKTGNNYIFFGDITDGKSYAGSGPITLICSCYKVNPTRSTSASVVGSGDDCSISINNAGVNATRLLVKDTQYTSAESFTAAVTGQKVVYELATPLTYHLSPEEIETLLGENNIWTDAGDVEVTYLANTRVSNADAMNYLLGGMYTPGDVSDSEALNILLGGET